MTTVTNWGNGDGAPGTGRSPEPLSFDAPAWWGTKANDNSQFPGLDDENGWASSRYPVP